MKMSDGVAPSGSFLDNDTAHNFANLGRDFLDAAKVVNKHFKNAPMWPTYLLVFQSLENYLKAYLLAHGATLNHVKHKIGHRISDALAEAKA